MCKKNVDKEVYNRMLKFQRLKETGSGYLVGTSLTMADVGFLEVLLLCVEFGGDDFLDEHSEVKVHTCLYIYTAEITRENAQRLE